MCRFTLYLGPRIALSKLLTEPSHSILEQSQRSAQRHEPTNGDGFGIAWYVPEQRDAPARFRSVTPAWSDPNLVDLARVAESDCILAHVRAATQGNGVATANCHPFRHRQWTFMHNGDIGGFPSLRRALLQELSDESFRMIEGSTDSEHAFGLVLDELRAGADLPVAVERAVARIVELARTHADGRPCYLNFAVTDGSRAVATRFTTESGYGGESLYLSRGREYACVDGVCLMQQPGLGGGAVVVSSEPLSSDPGWETVPTNHMVVVEPDRSVELRPMD